MSEGKLHYIHFTDCNLPQHQENHRIGYIIKHTKNLPGSTKRQNCTSNTQTTCWGIKTLRAFMSNGCYHIFFRCELVLYQRISIQSVWFDSDHPVGVLGLSLTPGAFWLFFKVCFIISGVSLENTARLRGPQVGCDLFSLLITLITYNAYARNIFINQEKILQSLNYSETIVACRPTTNNNNTDLI